MPNYRIVEHQAKIYEVNATSTERRADLLRAEIEKSKPELLYPEWHDIIATQFRYPLPVELPYEARFRPAGSTQNIYYASEQIETALFEHSYHFVRVRTGLTRLKKAWQRTSFVAELIESAEVADVSAEPDVDEICSKLSYEGSYQYLARNPRVKVIRYPSARDPERRANLAIRDIHQIQRRSCSESTVSFSLDHHSWTLKWLENDLEIKAREVFPNLFEGPTQPTGSRKIK